jgi:hypothetical protein
MLYLKMNKRIDLGITLDEMNRRWPEGHPEIGPTIDEIIRHEREATQRVWDQYKRDIPRVINRAKYDAALAAFTESIETLFMYDESHKCYSSEVLALVGNTKIYKCMHRVRNKVICRDCEFEIRNQLGSYPDIFTSDDITANQYKKYWHRTCIVAGCTSVKRHRSLKKLRRCKCFQNYEPPDGGAVSFNGFRTLLLALNRYKIQIPRDIRQYIYYKFCGGPKNYFVYNSYIHSVFDVRNIKQAIISNQTQKVCPELLHDYTPYGANILRIKYKFHHTIRENPGATHMNIKMKISEYFKLLLLNNTGFGFSEVCNHKKIVNLWRIKWLPQNITKMCENSLLKIDPRFPLLML